jgi:hypothetical protein
MKLRLHGFKPSLSEQTFDQISSGVQKITKDSGPGETIPLIIERKDFFSGGQYGISSSNLNNKINFFKRISSLRYDPKKLKHQPSLYEGNTCSIVIMSL